MVNSARSKSGDVTLLSFLAAPLDAARTAHLRIRRRNHGLDHDDFELVVGFGIVMQQDQRIVETQRPEEIPTAVSKELHIRFPDAASIQYRRFLRELDKAEAFAP